MTDQPTTSSKQQRSFALIAAFALLAAVVATGGLLIAQHYGGQAASPATANRVSENLVDVSVAPAWKTLSSDAVLTRIGVGSCLHQDQPQPIWESVIAANPQLFLLVGDNVYGDIREGDPNELGRAYQRQGAQPELKAARAAFPFLASWDDHDYGLNDGGIGFVHQPAAAHFFRTFWSLADADQPDGGIYYARSFGPPGQRVQIIMLDTRSFRSDLTRKSDTFPHWGKYEPDPDPSKTILGSAQWAWLKAQLREPADVRLVVSSVQILADGHGFERWGNLPAERQRLKAAIRETGARGVVLLSGDRHSSAVFRERLDDVDDQVLVEMTSSSLNRSFGPSRDTKMAPLVSEIVHQENFGTLEIDWEKRNLRMVLQGAGGQVFAEIPVSFDELGVPAP